jgi:hypothetical protein
VALATKVGIMISKNRSPALLFALAALLLAVAMPAEAQREFEPLFDKFNVSAQFSWVGLDSETLGTGTTLNFDDFGGGNYVGRASIEYLLGKRWSFGAAIDLADANVDVGNIEDEEGNPEFTARVDQDVNDFSVFARVRF